MVNGVGQWLTNGVRTVKKWFWTSSIFLGACSLDKILNSKWDWQTNSLTTHMHLERGILFKTVNKLGGSHMLRKCAQRVPVWRISGVDGQVINNQGYQSHWGCQSYLTRDTRGKWIKQREVSTPYMWNGSDVVVISSLRL